MPANSRPAVENHKGHLSLSVQSSSCTTLRLYQIKTSVLGPTLWRAPHWLHLFPPEGAHGPKKCVLSLDYIFGTQVPENLCANSSEAASSALHAYSHAEGLEVEACSLLKREVSVKRGVKNTPAFNRDFLLNNKLKENGKGRKIPLWAQLFLGWEWLHLAAAQVGPVPLHPVLGSRFSCGGAVPPLHTGQGGEGQSPSQDGA